MKLQILPVTAEAMRRYGWTEERKVDILATREMLERLGHFVGPIAEEILSNLTGLEIVFNEARRTWAKFDADQTETVYSKHKETAAYLANWIGEPICRLGETSVSDFFVTQSGRIIVVDEEWYAVSIVQNIEVFLDSLLTVPPRKSWQVIEIPEEKRPSPYNLPSPPGKTVPGPGIQIKKYTGWSAR